jgi:lysophospholipase L1-like esterase
MRRSSQVIIVTALAVLVGSCGDSPIQPTPPPTLTITCPANRSVQSPDGNPAGVSFDAPQTIGGANPVTTTCTPASGAQFPVGNTTVTCEARDSGNRLASCSFMVQIQGPPRLTSSRFLAFGDSLTWGVISASVTTLVVSVPDSYPFELQDRLVARYRQQLPVVLNEGNPGELASDTGIQRFRSVLLSNRPEVVLLMEGTNDLLFGQSGANNAITALQAMIREAKSQNIRILLSTVPPQRAGGARQRDAVVALIPGFNDRIRALASAESIPLIDVYDGMKDDISLIGVDDLHPTIRGYDVMADIFYSAIRTNFENQAVRGLRR